MNMYVLSIWHEFGEELRVMGVWSTREKAMEFAKEYITDYKEVYGDEEFNGSGVGELESIEIDEYPVDVGVSV